MSSSRFDFDFTPLLKETPGQLDYDFNNGLKIRILQPVGEQGKPSRQTPIRIVDIGKGCIDARLALERKHLHVENSLVTPEHRRRGVATRMTEHLFAAAMQLGILTSGGVVGNYRPLRMYEKMVGADNIRIIATDSPDDSFEGVIEHLPDNTYLSDGPYCHYEVDLNRLKPEHKVHIPDISIDLIQ